MLHLGFRISNGCLYFVDDHDTNFYSMIGIAVTDSCKHLLYTARLDDGILNLVPFSGDQSLAVQVGAACEVHEKSYVPSQKSVYYISIYLL